MSERLFETLALSKRMTNLVSTGIDTSRKRSNPWAVQLTDEIIERGFVFSVLVDTNIVESNYKPGFLSMSDEVGDACAVHNYNWANPKPN